MTNFSFLDGFKEYDDLREFCNDAESFVLTKPDFSAISARKALEFMVKTVYVSKCAYLPENASLFELVDNFVFSGFVSNAEVLSSLHYIRKVGNRAAHGEKIKKNEGLLCLKNLHYFVGEMLVKLGAIKNYQAFDETLLTKTEVEPKHIKSEVVLSEEYEKFVGNKIARNDVLKFSKNPKFITEADTRKLYIDEALKSAGWSILSQENTSAPASAGIEIEVSGMPNLHEVGFCDYVLFGKDSRPLAVVEAKKTSVDAIKGQHQAELYADALERQYGVRPVIYYTNGFEIHIIDGLGYPPRKVFGFHTLDELELLIQRKTRKNIVDLSISDEITNRPYQKMAITKVCEHFNSKKRKALLVMATGTGKTRVAISLVDVLKRNKWVKNVLFLADRTALVNQAKKNFVNLLTDETTCELSDKTTKRDLNARIIFSTYQTMINFIDKDEKDFSIGRFDLIIIDEAHRSIFNKYGAIFDYFDALLVGLTATPRSDVDKNTYDLFEMEIGEPNFHYELDEAVKEGYLVNYVEFDRTLEVLKSGVKYSKLSNDEKRQVEMSYGVDEETPVDVAPNDVFRVIYNKDTVDKVLQDLMENGIKVSNGDKIGKSIIFAYNHAHAQLIVERFNILYPEFGPNFCKLIDNYVTYAHDLILKFENRKNEPQIAVSVDMLDTGIDVPDILNLVFFKPVKSKIKFLQMIGRGTRLSANIFGPGKDKKKFYIFDYCNNFEYFEQNPNLEVVSSEKTITERLFSARVDLLFELQALEYQENQFARAFYNELKQNLIAQVAALNKNRIQVRNNLAYVEKYQFNGSWDYISKVEVKELKTYIAKLIVPDKDLDSAKIFDLKIIIVELSLMNKKINSNKQINDVIQIANTLSTMTVIPQIKEHIEIIKSIKTEVFWKNASLDSLEKMRVILRELIKFIENEKLPISVINVPDELTFGNIRNGIEGLEIKTYEEKVLEYLARNSKSSVISKIKNLEKINSSDMAELQRILWSELGTKDDYVKYTDKENLAVFIRSLVGLSQNAVNEKFSMFLNKNVLNSRQQEFIKVIINYVRENGDITLNDLQNSQFENYEIVDMFGEKFYILKLVIEQLHNAVCA